MSPLRDGVTPLTLIQGGLAPDGTSVDDADVPSRRCGRCLDQFPGDPNDDPVAMPDFWTINSSILSSTVPRQTNLCTKTLRF